MDMRTEFSFVIDGNDHTTKVETWQEALSDLMNAMQSNGFTIDDKRKKQIVELAKFGRVTV